jgi:hypothetical protein
LTQHQLAVEHNRRQRIEYLLAKRKSNAYRVLRAKRESEIPFSRYGRQLQSLPDGYDSEDGENSWGKGGLFSNPAEEDDFGECASFFLSVARKASRRLDRWDYEDANGPKRDRKKERQERQRVKAAIEAEARAGNRSRARPSRGGAAAKRKSGGAAVAPGSAKKPSGELNSKGGRSRPSNGPAGAAAWETEHTAGDDYMEGELDDLDRELLGEGSGDEGPRRDAGLEECYVGEGGDSSDEEEDEVDDENSSTYDGPNGYARHESSSPVPETAAATSTRE